MSDGRMGVNDELKKNVGEGDCDQFYGNIMVYV
jgi:hypothetical protein